MQIFTYVSFARKFPVRILCALLIVSISVLVYSQDVHAAEQYNFSVVPAGLVPAESGTDIYDVVAYAETIVLDSAEIVSSYPYIYRPTNSVFYDFKVPFRFYCPSLSGTHYATFEDNVWMMTNIREMGFGGGELQDKYYDFSSLTFYDCYIESDDVSLVFLPEYGISFNTKVEDEVNYGMAFQLRPDSLRFRGSYSDVFYVHFVFWGLEGYGHHDSGNVAAHYKLPDKITFRFSHIGGKITLDDSIFDSDDSEVGKLQDIEDTIEQQHQEEIDKGNSSGDEAGGMVDDLTGHVKSKWEILFYPIEFTKKFLALFTGSSGGSTSIQFPAFSLEVDGTSYQVWDAYTFDLASLQSDFSLLFNGIHLVVGTIEVTAFIKYLYHKYDEVFGGGS